MKRRLIKWLGGLVVIVLLVVFLAPGGVGMLAEGRYKQVWENALAKEPGLDAEVVRYDRGWFNADSTVRITFNEPVLAEMMTDLGWAETDEQGRAVFHLEERVHHGPVPFTAPAPISQRWKPGFAAVDSRPDANLPFMVEHGIELSSTTHLGLLGGLNGHVRIEPFDAQIEDDLIISSDSPITLDVRSNHHLDRVDARLRGGQISLGDHSGDGVTLEQPWVRVEQRRGPADLWLGGTELRLAAMEMRVDAGAPMRMEGLVWATLTNERGELIGQEHEVYLESLSAAGFQAGPARLDYDLFNLHPQSLADLQAAMADSPGFDMTDPGTSETAFLEAMREPMLGLAEHRPGMKISRLDFQLPGGTIDGDGEIQLRDLSRAEIESLLEEMNFILLVNGEGRLSASRDLVRRSIAMSMMGTLPDGEMEDDMAQLMDMQIDSAIDEGMLSETEAGNLEIRVKLEDGVFLVNDREMVRF